jgi:hypothetical protein
VEGDIKGFIQVVFGFIILKIGVILLRKMLGVLPVSSPGVLSVLHKI